jgi:excisionase family DNA binding protein
MDASISAALSNFHTPEELAMRWKCSTAHVRNLIHRGALQAIKIGVLWRVPTSEVHSFERHFPSIAKAA